MIGLEQQSGDRRHLPASPRSQVIFTPDNPFPVNDQYPGSDGVPGGPGGDGDTEGHGRRQCLQRREQLLRQLTNFTTGSTATADPVAFQVMAFTAANNATQRGTAAPR